MSVLPRARQEEHELAELQDLLSRLQTHEEDGNIGLKLLPDLGLTDKYNKVKNTVNGINRKYILGLCELLCKEEGRTEAKLTDQCRASLDLFIKELKEEYTPKQKDVYITNLAAHWNIVSADLEGYLKNKRYTDLQVAQMKKYITKITAGMTSYLKAWKGALKPN